MSRTDVAGVRDGYGGLTPGGRIPFMAPGAFKGAAPSDADSVSSSDGGGDSSRKRHRRDTEQGASPSSNLGSPTGSEAAAPPGPAPTNSFDGLEVLAITEEPAAVARFRYQAEGRQNCLVGRNAGRPLAVAVNPKLRYLIPDGTLVSVSPVTRFDGPDGRHVPHWHVIEDRDGGTTDRPLCGGRAEFGSLVVKRLRSDVRHNADDQRVIRVLFSLAFTDLAGVRHTAEVVSTPIFSTELKVDLLSHEHGDVHGGNRLFILCSKVQRRTIAVRVTDTVRSSWIPPAESGWILDADSFPTFLVRPKDLRTHHQFAVIATMPPYHSRGIAGPRTVQIQLVDTADGIESAPVPYVYHPARPGQTWPGPPGPPGPPESLGAFAQQRAFSQLAAAFFGGVRPAAAAPVPAGHDAERHEPDAFTMQSAMLPDAIRSFLDDGLDSDSPGTS